MAMYSSASTTLPSSTYCENRDLFGSSNLSCYLNHASDCRVILTGAVVSADDKSLLYSSIIR